MLGTPQRDDHAKHRHVYGLPLGVLRVHSACRYDSYDPLVLNWGRQWICITTSFCPDWEYNEADEEVFVVSNLTHIDSTKAILYIDNPAYTVKITFVPKDGIWKVIQYETRPKQ